MSNSDEPKPDTLPPKKALPRPIPGQQTVRLSPTEKAKRNPTSLRLAINAKCYDCGGFDADPGWHGRIRHCVIPGCPLYPVRPFQTDDED